MYFPKYIKHLTKNIDNPNKVVFSQTPSDISKLQNEFFGGKVKKNLECKGTLHPVFKKEELKYKTIDTMRKRFDEIYENRGNNHCYKGDTLCSIEAEVFTQQFVTSQNGKEKSISLICCDKLKFRDVSTKTIVAEREELFLPIAEILGNSEVLFDKISFVNSGKVFFHFFGCSHPSISYPYSDLLVQYETPNFLALSYNLKSKKITIHIFKYLDIENELKIEIDVEESQRILYSIGDSGNILLLFHKHMKEEKKKFLLFQQEKRTEANNTFVTTFSINSKSGGYLYNSEVFLKVDDIKEKFAETLFSGNNWTSVKKLFETTFNVAVKKYQEKTEEENDEHLKDFLKNNIKQNLNPYIGASLSDIFFIYFNRENFIKELSLKLPFLEGCNEYKNSFIDNNFFTDFIYSHADNKIFLMEDILQKVKHILFNLGFGEKDFKKEAVHFLRQGTSLKKDGSGITNLYSIQLPLLIYGEKNNGTTSGDYFYLSKYFYIDKGEIVFIGDDDFVFSMGSNNPHFFGWNFLNRYDGLQENFLPLDKKIILFGKLKQGNSNSGEFLLSSNIGLLDETLNFLDAKELDTFVLKRVINYQYPSHLFKFKIGNGSMNMGGYSQEFRRILTKKGYKYDDTEPHMVYLGKKLIFPYISFGDQQSVCQALRGKHIAFFIFDFEKNNIEIKQSYHEELYKIMKNNENIVVLFSMQLNSLGKKENVITMNCFIDGNNYEMKRKMRELFGNESEKIEFGDSAILLDINFDINLNITNYQISFNKLQNSISNNKISLKNIYPYLPTELGITRKSLLSENKTMDIKNLICFPFKPKSNKAYPKVLGKVSENDIKKGISYALFRGKMLSKAYPYIYTVFSYGKKATITAPSFLSPNPYATLDVRRRINPSSHYFLADNFLPGTQLRIMEDKKITYAISPLSKKIAAIQLKKQ